MKIGDLVKANQYARWDVRHAKTGIIIDYGRIPGMAKIFMSDSVTRTVLTRYVKVISESR